MQGAREAVPGATAPVAAVGEPICSKQGSCDEHSPHPQHGILIYNETVVVFPT